MKKILIVDDSGTCRAHFRSYLFDTKKYEVFEADNLESALELFQEFKPDICVLDYNIPRSSGLEIAKSMLSFNIPTKFILMTAEPQQDILAEAKKLGFVAMLEKPLDADSVTSLLKTL